MSGNWGNVSIFIRCSELHQLYLQYGNVEVALAVRTTNYAAVRDD